jgi:hypothetical protein
MKFWMLPLPVELGLGTAVTLALLKGLITAFAGDLFTEVGVDVAICISFSFLWLTKI